MRLSISNIAWDPSEDNEVARALTEARVDAIDVAPTKYFPDPANTSDAAIAAVRAAWAARGVSIVGMQSLLFGTQGLNLFGDETVRGRMLSHLDAVCRIGAGLGASRLVFGSPKNRDRRGLSVTEADEIAAPFFRALGAIAERWGVVVCLEPNPERYGANYLTNSADTARLVKRIDHPAIKMQLDVGALAINGENPADVILNCADIIGHVHASEPDLVPLGDGSSPHALVASLLSKVLPAQVVTIEMLATANEPHVTAIRRALAAADRFYRATTKGAS